MWRPKEVVPQYRHRAVFVWGVLIVSILAYVGVLLYRAVSGRANPSTSFIISNEIYTYPDLWVCLYVGYGCDTYEDEEKCLSSIFNTEGGSTRARYRPGDAYEQNVSFTAELTDKRGWCVVFETSALEYKLGEERDADDYIDYTSVDVYWYPGGSANTSTTCIQEEGAWTFHKENIFAFLNDPLTGQVSAGIQIPYSCMTNESSSHYFTYVGIGVTEQHKLGGEESASYNALNLGTIEYKIERNDDITGIQAPYAYMKMELQQEPNSLVLVTEIDPLDMAELLGQVGGFWDLILILWPIFFVAAGQATPHLKPRNFRKSAVRAKEQVTSVGPTILRNLSVASTARDPPRSSFHDGPEEMLPAWDRGTPSCPQGNEVLIRLFEDHGLVAVINATSRLAVFLQSEFGASYLRRGAVEPSLKKLLPANTFLVMVPTNSTVLSVATRVARHCKDCSGQRNSEQVNVKVTRVSCSTHQGQVLGTSPYLSTGDNVDESVVDLGEVSVSRRFAPAYSAEDPRQLGKRSVLQRISTSFRWSNTPQAIPSPARRPLPAGAGMSIPRRDTSPRIGDRNDPPPSYHK